MCSSDLCIGARVNGRLVPLNHRLVSGDTCEIFTSKVESASPSEEWLEFISSPRARNKIRQWFSRERREDLIEVGREAFEREFRELRLPIHHTMDGPVFLAEAEHHGYQDADSLLAAVGDGQLGAKAIAQRIAHRIRTEEPDERLSLSVLNPREIGRAHV